MHQTSHRAQNCATCVIPSVIPCVVLAACALAGVANADPRNDHQVCGQTSHFLYDDGSGVLQEGISTSNFSLDTTFTPALTTRRGYDYYKALSDMNAAGLHANPFYSSNTHQGEMPSIAFMVVNPIANAPQGIDDAGLYVGNDATGLPDQWDGMTVRVDLFNDALELVRSYTAQGRVTLLGTSSGTAMLSGVTNTYSFTSDVPRLMIPSPGPFGATSNETLYLQSITFTTTIVPAPGAAALLGIAGLVATRRRRN